MHIISGNTSEGGHYSAGIVSRGMLYISGQLPIDHDAGEPVPGSIEKQTRVALRNVARILANTGLRKESVALCRVHISDVRLWNVANRVYAKFLGEHEPARVVAPTRELHHGALVEIETIAEMPEES